MEGANTPADTLPPAPLNEGGGSPHPRLPSTQNVVTHAEMADEPAWMIDTVWPASVSVPSRVAPALAATEKIAAPDPVFADAEVSAMKLLLLTALHAQPDNVETATDASPPPAAAFSVVADSEYPHVRC